MVNMTMELERTSKAQEMVRVTRALVVSVVDDDVSVRESLPDLLREFGFAVRTFSSALEFLASDCISQTSCLLLDVRMPGMSGPVLQQELRRLKREIPIIFITAPADERLRSDLIEQGAAACLFKPFSDTALYEALDAAVGMN
jgi:FixJ family two-component response regulator